MKKLLLAGVMALGMGMGSAFAATPPAPPHNNYPHVIHWGTDYENDSGSVA